MTPKKEKALNALLTSRTFDEAAKLADISPRTLYRYRQDEEFKAEYEKAVGELIGDASDRLKMSLSSAIETLYSIASDSGEMSGNRISASRALLEYGLKYSEYNDVLLEIRAMEGKLW